MTDTDEVVLVQRTLAGDTGAFGELVDAYEKVLFNTALRMVNDREEARDLTQTAFLKAYRNLESYDPKHRFFSWIYRILMNETLNLLARRRPNVALDERLVARERRPDEQAETNEIGAIVEEALMELTPDYRQVVILRHFLQFSHREIGDLLHVPEKTVKSRLYTARQQLGGILQRRGVTSS